MLHNFAPNRLTPAELDRALPWTGPNCRTISGPLLLLCNSPQGGLAEGGGCYLIVARMSAATSGSSHLLWFPHIAALMRATCWGMGPTRSRDRRRRVLFDCSPHEHSDIRFFAFAMVPAYRCAHAGYLLGYGADGIERPKAAGVI